MYVGHFCVSMTSRSGGSLGLIVFDRRTFTQDTRIAKQSRLCWCVYVCVCVHAQCLWSKSEAWNWQTAANLLATQPRDWRLHGEKVGGRGTRYYCGGQGWAEWAITSIRVSVCAWADLCAHIYLPIAISPMWWYQFSQSIALAIELLSYHLIPFDTNTFSYPLI